MYREIFMTLGTRYSLPQALYELVAFSIQEQSKAEEQLRLLDLAEMQKMAQHELKDLPPLGDSSMPGGGLSK